MFICGVCKRSSTPKEKPTYLVMEAQEQSYFNYDEDGERKISSGVETVIENLVCRGCMGLNPIPTPNDPTYRINMLGAQGAHSHAGGCKKMIGECKMCNRSLAFFSSIPLNHLPDALGEPATQRATFQLATLTMESTFNRGTMKGERAMRDKAAGMRLLQEYESMGGKLRN